MCGIFVYIRYIFFNKISATEQSDNDEKTSF